MSCFITIVAFPITSGPKNSLSHAIDYSDLSFLLSFFSSYLPDFLDHSNSSEEVKLRMFILRPESSLPFRSARASSASRSLSNSMKAKLPYDRKGKHDMRRECRAHRRS